MGWPGTGVELRVGNPGRGGAVLDREPDASAVASPPCRDEAGPPDARPADRPDSDAAAAARAFQALATPLALTSRARPIQWLVAQGLVAQLRCVRATGAAGIGIDAGGMGAAGVAGGMGCRGPDKIWPGRGAGTGRAGMGPVRNGGCSGAAPPAARGGLKGAGLLRSGSSTVETVASSEVSRRAAVDAWRAGVVLGG